MQTGLSQLFDPYNLYAKAFPGIVSLIFVLSLLPDGSLAGIGNSGSLIAALALLLIVLGFIFGQAIHSISGFIESTVYVTLRNYYVLFNTIRDWVFNSETAQTIDQNPEFTRLKALMLLTPPATALLFALITGDLGLILAMIIGAAAGIFAPVGRLRRHARAILTPHREIFQKRISRDDVLAGVFVRQVADSIDGMSVDSVDDIYLLAMSRLEYAGTGRARLFQAIFSFSRSLWIITLSFSALYILIGWEFSPIEFMPNGINASLSAISNYRPTVSSIVGEGTGMVLVGFVMIFTSLLFFRSEAKYKKLYVDYVIADYLTLSFTEDRSSEDRII